MGRRPCCSKEGMNRGAWTALEDKILVAYIEANGEGQWRNLPERAGLKRCGKSCRLRWLNYLRPDIKRGNISHDEEDLIIRLHNLLGNRWSLIAGRLPGRTDNEIKNYWNSTLAKKAKAQSKNSTTKSASPSPNPSIENRSLRKQATEQPHSSQPTQVIRTRATRCTKVVIPFDYQTAAELPQSFPDWGQQSGSQYLENDSLPSDREEEPMINDWINSLNENAMLDLDSFAALLESEEWP